MMLIPARASRVLASALLLLLLLVGQSGVNAQDSPLESLKIQGGVQFRSVNTHWAAYTPAGTFNSWETFKLFGLSGDLLFRVADLEKTGLYLGGGAAVYMGSYDYEASTATGNASAGPGGEIRLMAEVDHAPSADIVLTGQIGASLLYITGEAAKDPNDSYGVYDYDFEQGIPTLFIAGGLEKPLSGGRAAALLLRYDVVEIGSWTDMEIASREPWIESADGFSAQLMLRF